MQVETILPIPEVKSLMNPVELQREDEALKLKMFWEEHSPQKLNEVMRLANLGSAREDGIDCSCLACIRSHRVALAFHQCHHTLYDVPCKFKNFFEYELRELDMSIGRDVPDPDLPIRAQRRVVNSDNNVLDDGQHFHNSARRDGVHWTYGSKLLKATSVGDPELAKLESLFISLRMIGY